MPVYTRSKRAPSTESPPPCSEWFTTNSADRTRRCAGLLWRSALIPGQANTIAPSGTVGPPWAMTKKHVYLTADRLIYIPRDRRDGSAVLDFFCSMPSLPRHALFARSIVVTIRKRLMELNWPLKLNFSHAIFLKHKGFTQFWNKKIPTAAVHFTAALATNRHWGVLLLIRMLPTSVVPYCK